MLTPRLLHKSFHCPTVLLGRLFQELFFRWALCDVFFRKMYHSSYNIDCNLVPENKMMISDKLHGKLFFLNLLEKNVGGSCVVISLRVITEIFHMDEQLEKGQTLAPKAPRRMGQEQKVNLIGLCGVSTQKEVNWIFIPLTLERERYVKSLGVSESISQN